MDRARREELPHIPFGSGICGHVAQSKEVVVIKDAYGVSDDDEEIALIRLLAQQAFSSFCRFRSLPMERDDA